MTENLYWGKWAQDEYDEVKNLSLEELIKYTEKALEDLTCDLQPYIVLELIKKQLGFKYKIPNGQPKAEFINSGIKEDQITEMRL